MNRERLINVALFMAALLAGLFLAGVLLSLFSADEPDYVSGAIEKTVQDPQRSELALRDVTNFPWRKAVIIAPYTPLAEVERILGFKWSFYENFDIATSDSDNLIIFLSKGEVMHASSQPRNKGDFAADVFNKILDQEDAIFKIEHGKRPMLRFATLK